MDCDNDTSSEPDQYARDNHLSIDSRIDPFSLVVQINDSVPQLTPDVGHNGLTGDGFLPQLHLPTVGLQEQLDVTEESIGLLASITRYDKIDIYQHCAAPLAQYDARKSLAKLKLDRPALFSDPDYDCRELARTIQQRRQPNFSSNMFPPERLSTAEDEGLKFPDSAGQLRRELGRVIRGEKLDVPKDAICHLALALKYECCDSEYYEVLEKTISCRTSVRDLAVTPPLSPLSGSETYFVPDAEICDVPIASSCSSMLCDDLRAAESAILRKEFDEDAAPMINLDIQPPSPLLGPPSLGSGTHKISSIRLESPLSPITSPLRSTDGGLNIPSLLKSIDIDHVPTHSESAHKFGFQINPEDETLDHDLQAVIEESAATVSKSIEQENISIANAMARVQVPFMDFSIPELSWQGLPMDSRAHLEWLYEVYNIEIPRWPKNPWEDSKLRWVPFLQKVESKNLTQETIDSERNISQLTLLDFNEVPSSANYVWKRPGLAILRELETEDLEKTAPPIKTIDDAVCLARKRFEGNHIEIEMSESDSSVDLVRPLKCKRSSRRTVSDNLASRTGLLPSIDSDSAVSSLLSNFMEIRTAKRRKQNHSVFFPPVLKLQAKSQSVIAPKDTSRPFKIADTSQKKAKPPAPCPNIGIPSAPTKVIKSLALSRQLFTALERLYPAAEIIERDFDRWNTVTRNHYSVSRPIAVSYLAAEADMIVSPITGIVVTTLLKVIQKPLPGQGGQSSLYKRIARIALRYERLIVLVSEGNVVDETVRELTPSEAVAYAEFVGFATNLDSEVEVFYVGGGETTLASWLVFFANRYAPEAADIQEHITQDETQWEVFLRRAGFNAYAAQAILVRLKTCSYSSGGRGERFKHGLAAFVAMTDVERIQRFRDLMGGEGVLNRVSRILDAGWG